MLREVLCAVLVILAVLLALTIWGNSRRARSAVGGEAPARILSTHHHGHELSAALLAARREADDAAGAPAATGGASNATSGGTDWTKYDTWAELRGAPAYATYWADRAAVLKEYPADWSRVRDELKDALAEPREWAGTVNIVDGVPAVTRKMPSPHDVDSRGGASVPAHLVEAIGRAPAMFFFHTHPEPVSPLISGIDAAAAVIDGYQGRYAAHLVVSPTAITMYGLSPDTLADIQNTSNPRAAAARLAYDLYNAVDGLRSYHQYYSVRDLAAIMRKMGMVYAVYPLDPFVRVAHNHVFVSSSRVDVESAQAQLDRVKDAQAQN